MRTNHRPRLRFTVRTLCGASLAFGLALAAPGLAAQDEPPPPPPPPPPAGDSAADTAAPLPFADPAHDQSKVDFDPVEIPDGPAGPISLGRALDRITEGTQSCIRFLGPNTQVLAEEKEVDLDGLTFWEAYDVIRDAWNVHVSVMGGSDGKLFVNFGTPAPDEWNPLGAGRLRMPYGARLLREAVTEGAFKVAYEAFSRRLQLHLYPEPRLRHFQVVKSALRAHYRNGKSEDCSLIDRSRGSWITFDFSLDQDADALVAVESVSQLVYPHDWRLFELGTIEDLTERRRPNKAGKLTFAVRSATVKENDEGKAGVELELEIGSDFLARLAEFYVVDREGARCWRGPRWTYHGEGRTEVFFGPLPAADLSTLELWVRAPQKLKTERVKSRLDLR